MGVKTLRARLTFWYSSLFCVTFLLLAGAAYWLLDYSLSRDLDASLNSVAKVLVAQAHKSADTFFPPDIDAVFKRFFGFSPMDRYFEMLDPKGRRDPQKSRSFSEKLPLSPKALNNASQGLHTFETMEGLGKYPVRVLTAPVIKGGRVIHMVQVGMSLESIYFTRHRFLLIALGLLPICLLLAGGGGWLLARRALRPVDHMTAAAHRISAEALGDRLQETGSGDELDRLATTLNRMLGRLDDAFSQIRRFSADASHELQTPLTILKGELEVGLRAPRTPAEYRKILNSSLEEINRLANLVEGLLLLARADAGVLRMDLRPMDLEPLLAEVYGQTKVLAEARNVDFVLEHSAPVSIRGDYERLRRLLLNLIDNGIKYSPSGGRVALSLKAENGWAVLRVTDTGIGIPRDEQEQVFQPFYRADNRGPSVEGGVGLGLSIANSIAEAHGGKIEVDSTPGQGAVFRVLLPLLV